MLLLGRRDPALLPTLHAVRVWIALAAVVILLVYKIAVIGW
jgi:hypothetical protein